MRMTNVERIRGTLSKGKVPLVSWIGYRGNSWMLCLFVDGDGVRGPSTEADNPESVIAKARSSDNIFGRMTEHVNDWSITEYQELSLADLNEIQEDISRRVQDLKRPKEEQSKDRYQRLLNETD